MIEYLPPVAQAKEVRADETATDRIPWYSTHLVMMESGKGKLKLIADEAGQPGKKGEESPKEQQTPETEDEALQEKPEQEETPESDAKDPASETHPGKEDPATEAHPETVPDSSGEESPPAPEVETGETEEPGLPAENGEDPVVPVQDEDSQGPDAKPEDNSPSESVRKPVFEEGEAKPAGCIRLPALLFPSAKPVESVSGRQEAHQGVPDQPVQTAPVLKAEVPAASQTFQKPAIELTADSAALSGQLMDTATTGLPVQVPAVSVEEKTGNEPKLAASVREDQSPQLKPSVTRPAEKEMETLSVKTGGQLFTWSSQEGLSVLEEARPAELSRFQVQDGESKVTLSLPKTEPILSAQVDGHTVPVTKDEAGNSVIEVSKTDRIREVKALTASGRLVQQQIGAKTGVSWLSLWPALLAPVIWLGRKRHA